MAGKSTTLVIKILSDSKDASKGFADAETKVSGFQRGLDRASAASGALLAGMAAVATQTYQDASALQQSSGAIESVFGAQAAAVEDYAQRASTAVGLSQNSYQELAATIGSQLKNMGVSTDQLAGQTNDLVTMGADLSATFGGTTADAVGALSSLMRGETDPIERYGVSIKQADIQARLAAQGLDDLQGPALRAAQTQAILGLLADQTASAQGGWNRETDTAAHQAQVASAAFTDASASLGTALLPMVTAVAEKLADLAGWMSDNTGLVQGLALVIGGLAGTVLIVNGALAAYRAITTIVTAVQWLFNTALFANPIFWIAAIIVGIIAVVVLLYNKFKPVRDIVSAIGGFFSDAFSLAMSAIQPVVDVVQWLADKLGDVIGWLGDVGSFIGDIFSAPGGGGGGGGGGGAMAYGAGPGGAVRGASPIIGLGGGSSPSTAQAFGPTTVVNINMDGLTVDGVATGRAIVRVLEDYGVSSGGRVSVQIGRR